MPSLRTWQTISYYDPIRDADAIRVSGFSGEGEYWVAEAKSPAGKSRRAQRERLLHLIEAAIERGDPPGEVKDDDRQRPAMDTGDDKAPVADEGWSPG